MALPMLQLGGMQDAVMAVPPTLVVVTSPLLLTVALPGESEAHVSGALSSWLPSRSRTVALTTAEVPFATENEVFVVALPTCIWMDFTRQVSNGVGAELTPAAVAKICVIPG